MKTLRALVAVVLCAAAASDVLVGQSPPLTARIRDQLRNLLVYGRDPGLAAALDEPPPGPS